MIETVAGVLFLGGIAASVGGVYATNRRRAWAAAEPLGLSVGLTLNLHGERDGFKIGCMLAEDRPNQHIQVDLDFRLPGNTQVRSVRGLGRMIADVVGERDVQLGNDLDPLLHIRGPLPEIRQLLTEPAVDAAIRALLAAEFQLLLEPSRLITKHAGDRYEGLAERVAQTLDLARALRDCWERPWADLVERLGLRDESTDDLRKLAGNVDGVALVVQQHKRTFAQTTLRVTAQLRTPLPLRTTLVHPAHGQGPSADLPDPILAGQVHARSDDPEALAARVCTDAVRGPLMEVVHGHPPSVVTSNRIGLLVPDSPLDPRPWVDVVLELEQALHEGAR